MIRTIRHRGLKRYWARNESGGISADWLPRITIILDRLNASKTPKDMDLPGFYFHALKGDAKGRYSVRVSGNFRITFGWDDGDAIDVDLEDYH